MATTLKDLTGQTFGRLTVRRRVGTYHCPDGIGSQPLWECVCECGNVTVVHRSSLTNRSTRSCGCLLREIRSLRAKEMGASNRMPVVQFALDGSLIKRYDSITQAHKETDVSLTGITECSNGHQKTAGGYIWKKEWDV